MTSFVPTIKQKFEKEAGRSKTKLLSQKKFEKYLSMEISIRDEKVLEPSEDAFSP